MIVVLLILGASCVAHELAHLLAGWIYGWHVKRFAVRWTGVGFAMSGDGDALWKIALAGPMANVILAAGFWLAMPAEFAVIGFVFNIVLAIANLLPIPTSDGGHIFQSLKQKR